MREEPGIFHNGDASAQQFLAFHARHPHVYVQLKRMAMQLRRKGYVRYSIKGLFEVLRFNLALHPDKSKWKLNNNLTAYYARLLMSREPVLKTFFAIREQRKPFAAEATP